MQLYTVFRKILANHLGATQRGQGSRCCCSGHGALNCGNSPRCIVCAGDHIAADCKYILAKHTGGNSQIHVISNVQIALAITVPPSRNVVSDLNTSKLWRRSGQPNPYLPLLMKPPSLRQSTGTPQFQQYQNNGLSKAFLQQPNPLQPTHQQIPQPLTSQANEDLYSMSECQSMMNDLHNALQACTCRQEQAKIIADYSFNL